VSNGNLTAVGDNTGAWESVRATRAATNTVFEFEVNLDNASPDQLIVGVENGADNFSVADTLPGSSDSNGVAIQLFSGNWYILRGGGAHQGPVSSPSPAQNQKITVACDKGAGTVAFYVAGTQIGSTETGVSLSSWFAYIANKGPSGQGTFNFAGPFSFGTNGAY
jgi:hypothetical protein